MLILMAIVTTLMTSPLLWLIYQRNYHPTQDGPGARQQLATANVYTAEQVAEAEDDEAIVSDADAGKMIASTSDGCDTGAGCKDAHVLIMQQAVKKKGPSAHDSMV